MIELIYEDNHLLVLNKPANLLTQESAKEKNCLVNSAKAWLKDKFGKRGNVFLEPIFRLDKVASGIVVFAKTEKALKRSMEAIRKREVKKIYLALVSRDFKKTEGELRAFLKHGAYRALVVDVTEEGAKFACLKYRVLKKIKQGTLLEIDLLTGRYHQIRCQLAFMGSAIIGDKKYGSKIPWNFDGIALHHLRFEMLHPTKKELLVFEKKPAWF